MNSKNDKQSLEQAKRIALAILEERTAMDKAKLLAFAGELRAMRIPQIYRPELRVALADKVQILAAWCIEKAEKDFR